MDVVNQNVAEIKLTKGLVAIVDADDYESLSKHKWAASAPKGDTNYAVSWINGTLVLMHRLLLNTPVGMHTDHINRNGLDNRRENLRVCTRSQNLANSKHQSRGISVFKGLRYRKNRNKPWIAIVNANGKRYTRAFYTEVAAARGYDELARQYHGEFARTNFP